jgi:hypothetical protein
MISKSHLRFVPSSLAWSHPSRQPCSSHLTSSRQQPRRRRLHVACAACRAAVPSTSSRRPATRAPAPYLITTTITLLPRQPHRGPHRLAPTSGPVTPRPPPPNTLVASRSTWCRPSAQSRAPVLAPLPIWAPTPPSVPVGKFSRPCSLSVC